MVSRVDLDNSERGKVSICLLGIKLINIQTNTLDTIIIVFFYENKSRPVMTSVVD